MHMNYILRCEKCGYRNPVQHKIDFDDPLNKFVPPECKCGSTDYDIEEKRLMYDRVHSRDAVEISCNSCGTLFMYEKGSFAICPICVKLFSLSIGRLKRQ